MPINQEFRLKQPKEVRLRPALAQTPSRARSELMARVRQHGTKAELAARALLRDQGLRIRTNVKGLPGSPDICVPSLKIAVFVHGCFWHRHRGCSATTSPKTNTAYWEKKFAQNVARDYKKVRALKILGYTVFVIWECETRAGLKLERMIKRLKVALSGSLQNEKKS